MISSNASTILPCNMNEKQRLHQEKEAEVGKVAALEAALDAFTVIRNPATTLCHVVSVTLCWEAAHSLHKMTAFKTFKWIVVDGQEVLLANTSHIDRVRRRRQRYSPALARSLACHTIAERRGIGKEPPGKGHA